MKKEVLRKKIGEILVDAGLTSREHLVELLEMQKKQGGKIGDLLVKKELVSKSTLLAVLGKQRGTTFVSIKELETINDEVIKAVPVSLLKKKNFMPVSLEGNLLTVAVKDPNDILIIDELKAMTGHDIAIVVADEEEILEAIDMYYDAEDHGIAKIVGNMDIKTVNRTNGDEVTDRKEVVLDSRDDEIAPVIKVVNFILTDAIKKRASDIHIEPFENTVRIRYRIDGVLQEMPPPPKSYMNAMISRIKIMSQLDISEHRMPQDGNMSLKVNLRDIDMRVSIVPTKHGEKAVIRILDSSNMNVNLENLGVEVNDIRKLKAAIEAPHGLVLVTGPTGSGKTTTLYSCLSYLNSADTNIVTAEDPVEYVLDGINQVQVRGEIGLTFPVALRAFLRQDPDVILVGEIRDLETVQVAVQAALTGHMVFSTLHTNDAASTIVRMLNMGIESFLITSSVILVVAQRIMRLVCDKCKETYRVPVSVLENMKCPPEYFTGEDTIEVVRGRGCENCAGTGYRGRSGIYEFMPITNDLRELIFRKEVTHRIREQAIKEGMVTLRESALRKVLSGQSTFEEMNRIISHDI